MISDDPSDHRSEISELLPQEGLVRRQFFDMCDKALKGESASQVIVNGRPLTEHEMRSVCADFVK